MCVVKWKHANQIQSIFKVPAAEICDRHRPPQHKSLILIMPFIYILHDSFLVLLGNRKCAQVVVQAHGTVKNPGWVERAAMGIEW